jgi:21S rRNA (GM2251-2'-O)-methyltransferase
LTKEDGQVQLPGGRKPVWVALDEVQDPQNFGAILRSCVYFGVDGIVTTYVCFWFLVKAILFSFGLVSREKKSSPLSAAVSKASAGGLEVAPLKIPGNLIRFLRVRGASIHPPL